MAQDDFNFMDLLEDDAWFEAAARREESVTCEALAGNGWGTHLGALMANPQGFSHVAQLRSIVLQAAATRHRVGFRGWLRGGSSERPGTHHDATPSAGTGSPGGFNGFAGHEALSTTGGMGDD
jgi:hypothetical protein